MQICELVSLKIAFKIRVTPDWKLAGGELPPLMAGGGRVPLSEQRPRLRFMLCWTWSKFRTRGKTGGRVLGVQYVTL